MFALLLATRAEFIDKDGLCVCCLRYSAWPISRGFYFKQTTCGIFHYSILRFCADNMTSLGRFRLITLDVTNTLLQYRTSPSKRYGEIGALFGVLCDNDKLALNYRANWYSLNRKYPNFGRSSQMPWQQWWHLLIANTFADSGAKIPDEKLDNFVNHLLELYKTSICWQHCNSCMDLLNYLHHEKTRSSQPAFALGIIANFDPRLDTLLNNMKINHFFDFAHNSYDCQVEKPSPEMFQKAIDAAKLPDLKPGECLHIGDGPTTDYLGAKAAGWHAALIHEKSPSYLNEKYGNQIDVQYVFPSLYDFQKKLSHNAIEWS